VLVLALLASAAGAAAPAVAQTTPVAAAPDTPRLETARRVMGRLWPDGLYRRMMSGTIQQIVDSTMASMGQIPVEEMAKAAGSKEDLGDIKGKSMAELMEAADPAYRERTRITIDVMMGEMIPLMEKAEPGIRESLAQSYARRFTAAQLADLDRFLATPSGSAFADQFFLAYTDPEVVQQMQSFTPELMKAMPAILTKVQAATAHLPPPRKPAAKTDN
jgi:hypothetical protein